jgi:hypothetical protein
MLNIDALPGIGIEEADAGLSALPKVTAVSQAEGEVGRLSRAIVSLLRIYVVVPESTVYNSDVSSPGDGESQTSASSPSEV